ncbi:hypothetical protein [Teredinibacter franksiae]|jgi:hypothetical protein|uniref:hypothetical protein n=1 Tax=Teredinibacter franksiae TaxID=2761453 RepID=UPI001626C295|nr:hypothetical protein [Teredinibacter franksiae]
MKQVKKTAEYTIFQRNDERYAIRNADKAWINGDDKVAILLKEGLMKKPEPKPEAPAAEEASGEEAAAE